ncbi:MAG: hypothetical protein SO015_00225 [Wujia sp.]|nr:hypothetical protein [Wujia sp.]MDY3726556.1 hypothetical protein [Wujia sp.]
MGAGLSMASVNKIKELANSREYSLALELVEHQDLSKSLNPQFLRLCGEIYIKNNRYEDARRCLIMAHRLAPESKRIMYVFVELYLRMGYFELAKTYYDMYMFDAGSCDSRQMEYVWTKHEHPDALKDMEQLIASYMHNLDYDWSFELYLVYKKEEKKEEAHSLAELYAASFKNSENSDRICAIEKGKESADTYFDVYASVQHEDNDEKYDALRSEEAELLVADDLRMHPKEAEITVMYEDAFTPAGSEKKVQKMLKKQDREEERKEKKLLKEQRKQEKKLEKEAAKAENPEEETTLEASAAEETKPETAVETVSEETKPETAVEAVAEETKPETAVEATAEKEEIEEAEIEKGKKRGLFSKIFRKKKEVEDDTTEYAELVQTSESEIIDAYQDDRPSENSDAEKAAETETVHAESETDSNETIDTMTTGQANDMRHKSKTMAKNVVVVDDDNDFEAEADTIEELAAKEKSDVEKKIEDKKPAFEFQTVELAPDDFEDQFQVDDFSDKLDAEFGEMKSYEPEPRIEIEVEESETEEPIIEEPEAEAEEPEVETEELEIKEPEVEIEEPEAETEEPEVEPELEVEEPEVEIEESEAETGEPEAEEPEAEIEEPETEAEEPEVEPALEIEEPEAEIEEPEAGQPEVEPEPESIIEESETEPELEIEEPEVEIEKPEVESEPESIIEESETEPELEIEEPEVESEPEAEEPVFRVAPFTTKPEKKKLDFPVFKSSLFPDYHKEVKNVENNFDEIMEEAQDKMTENMRKEAQMQKEAEELLASLGISLDSIPAPAVKEEQPGQQGPSRDELKASLKIDTNKKNLLKRIKEYR